MDVDQIITEILGDLKANRLQLPTLPAVAVKINDIIDRPDASARKMARVLGTDAALSARLIQAANSPLLRAHKPVDNVRSAIARLGMRTVRNLVTSFLVGQLFHSRYNTLRQQVAVLWNHSIHVAAISYVLALRFSKLNPDEAMLAGLIHDIGKLPITAKAEDHPQLANDADTMDDLSTRLHPALGKLIVQAWNFAPEFITAVAEHDNLQRHSPKLDLADIVTVANLHSYTGNRKTRNPHRDADWSSVPAFRKLGLDPLSSIDVLKEAHDEIREIQRLLT